MEHNKGVRRPEWVKGALIAVAALLVVWWNVNRFSWLWGVVFVAFEFAAVVFLMMAITVIRSLCRHDSTGSA